MGNMLEKYSTQQNAQASQGQNSDCCATAANQRPFQNLYNRNALLRRLLDGRDMTASDLGIVDQNLDEKIGMEPNPLDGTRLWDNS